MRLFTCPVTLGFIAVLVFLSLAPARSEPVRRSPRALQKTMHVVLYGVLTVLLVWCLSEAGYTSNTVYPLAWLLAVALGTLMELLQLQRPERVGDWADVARNAAGAAGGALVAFLIERV